MKKTILILLCIITLFSCSDDLSRSNAKKQIIKELNYPQDEELRVATEETNIYTSMAINNWEKYAKMGLLSYESYGQQNKTRGFGKVTIGGSGMRATLTRKGKKYLLENVNSSSYGKPIKVKQAELQFDEITGIQIYEEVNSAIVSYNVKRVNITPFGKAKDLKEEIINKTANFVKYDDGWRIRKESSR